MFHFPGKYLKVSHIYIIILIIDFCFLQNLFFLDISHNEVKEVTLETHPLTLQTLPHNDLTDTQQSRESDRTASQTSGSTSTDSDRTPVRVDSQDSQISDTETITDGHRWPRQNSVSTFFQSKWGVEIEKKNSDTISG